MRTKPIMIMLATLMLAVTTACGSSKGDRAASGGAIGAGVGAAGAAVTGGSVLAGGVLGGAAGAVAGALTDDEDIDLGKPAWD